MKKILFFISAILLSTQISLGQTYNFQAGTFNVDCTSGGTIHDSGGPLGDYGNNESIVMTLCPSNPGFGLAATMLEMGIEPPDEICIYDGNSTAANQLICYDNTTTVTIGGIVQATVNNASGCLTFEFISDATITGSFEFDLDCEPRCQTVLSSIDYTSPDTVIEDGDVFVNICLGDTLFVESALTFPDNNIDYPQSEATSTFEWVWGDGTPDATTQDAEHFYTAPGGYIAVLTAYDVNGCRNFQDQIIKVRVAPEPEFVPLEDSLFCLGEIDTLVGLPQGIIINGQVVQGDTVYFVPPFFSGDSIPLPDSGTNAIYSTSVNVTSFGANDVVENCGDIIEVCINIEHSYLGDLGIWLESPNGTIVDLKTFGSGGGGTYLGDATDGSSGIPGIGFTYCWNSNATVFLQNGPTVPTTISPGNAIAPGDYMPEDPFTNLVGSPLNGTWTLNIQDNLSIDDGTLFNWELNIHPCMYPEIDSFLMVYDFGYWDPAPSILGIVGDSNTIVIEPDSIGPFSYTYHTANQFGCEYDNTYNILVDGFEVEATPSDTLICGNDSVQLNATIVGVPTTCTGDYIVQPATFNMLPAAGFNIALGDDQVSNQFNIPFGFEFFCIVQNSVAVSSNGFITFSSTDNGCCSGENIPDPGFFGPNDLIALMWDDLNPGAGGTISLAINGVAPNRVIVVEFNNVPHFGGGNLITGQIQLFETSNIIEIHCQNCPASSSPIATMGIENFNGTVGYTPPGYNASGWSAVNEAWRFLPSSSLGAYNWQWSPNTGLTADDIPDPVAGPTVSTDYIIDATNLNNCTYSDTVTIGIGGSFALNTSPDTTICIGDTITIAAFGGGQTFAWIPNDGTISDTTVSNPMVWPDSTMTYTVFVDSFGCTSTRDITITVSDVQLDSTVVTDATCYNAADGMIEVFGSGGVGSYTYSLDGITYNAANPIMGVDTGLHDVYISDSIGCVATGTAVVNQPDSLAVINVVVDSTLCNGSMDGSISFDGLGGTMAYEYSIDNGVSYQALNSFTGLAAGNYQLIVRDANLCTSAVFDTAVAEPLVLTIVQDSIGNAQCGVDNGFIGVSSTGGTTAYTYALDGGLAQASGVFTGLSATTHQVIVTDANGCSDTLDFTILEDASVSLSLVSFDSVSCNGAMDAMIEVVASQGTLPYSFTISDGVTSTTGTDSVFTNLSGANYQVWVEDANGCSDTVDVVIFEPAVLDVTATQDSTLCFGDSNGQINLTATGGTLAYEYSDDNFATTQAGSSFAGLSSGTYMLYVRDANGCTDSVQQEVFEPDTLEITGVIVQDIDCAGDGDGSFTVSANGGTTPYSYSTDGITYQSSSTLGNLNGGTYTIYVRDINGCISTVVDSINEPTLLVLTLDSSVNVTCNGGNDGAIYTQASGGTPPYQFSVGGGSQAGGSFTGLTANNYTVTLTDGNGCTQTVNVVVTEPQPLIATINQTNVLCFGENNGSITIANVTGGTAPYQVQIDAGPFQPFIPNMVFDALTAGAYTINVVDANNCPSFTQIITITEPASLAIDQVQTVGTDPSCAGEADGTISIVTNNGGTQPYTFNAVQTQSGDTLTNGTGSFTGLVAGIYPVWVEDANGCIDQFTLTLTDPAPVVLQIDTAIGESCLGYGDGQIRVVAIGGVAPFTYELSDGTPQDGPGTFTNMSPGQYTIIATDANGCTDDETTIVAPGAVVDAQIVADTTTIYMGDTLHLMSTLDNSTGELSYVWTPVEGLSCTDCADPVVLIFNDEEFTVTITDSLGCADDESIDITVIDSLFYFIPNAFTPGNDDNMNEDFRVYGQDIKYVEMMVYNRWGEKLFESANPFVRWDGVHKGVLQQPGVYTYYVKITFLNDKTVEAKGSVSLLR